MTETTTRPYLTEVPRLTELVQGDEILVTMGIPGLPVTVDSHEIVEEIDATRGWLTTRMYSPVPVPVQRYHYGANHPAGEWVRTLVAISAPMDRP